MREMIRGVILVSLILSVVAFLYVVGFAPLDTTRSPRAAAINAGPNVARSIRSIRLKMAQAQFESASAQAVDLVGHAPDSVQARLYAVLTLHLAGHAEEAGEYGVDLIAHTDRLVREGLTLGEAELYQRGWGMRALGLEDDARANFRELAELIEGLPEFHPNRNLYNLACYWALAGDVEAAMRWWERCVKGGGVMEAGYWRVDPDLEALHGEARFWELGQMYLVDANDVSQLVPVPDTGVESLSGGEVDGVDGEP